MSFVTAVLYFHETLKALNFNLGKFSAFCFKGLFHFLCKEETKLMQIEGKVLNKSCVLLL